MAHHIIENAVGTLRFATLRSPVSRNDATDQAPHFGIEELCYPLPDVGVRQRGNDMKFSRRKFLRLVKCATVLAALPQLARAQTYPLRPVRLIVGFSAGGGSDIVARTIGQRLSEALGQQFVVENRTGAASNIATETAINAAPDGYTLLIATTANAVNATLYDRLDFDFIRDVVPVAACVGIPNVLSVHPSVPVNTVAEFIAYANANPNKLNMGSGGPGGPVHMTGELFMMMSGVKLVHIPYRGEALALADLMGNHVQVVFGSMAASLEYARAGKIRALAVTTSTRSETMPELPTVADTVPGYESSTWYGIAAPKNTQAVIVEKLNRTINAALADPALQARLRDFGGSAIGGSPADFGRLIADETEKWAKVVKFSGVKPE
jgi:tripartite-type tricarboxylate transporter receptor subunit TctC